MDNLVVHAGAQRGGVSFVVQEGGRGVVLADQLLGIHIQGSGTHTGLDSLAQLLQHLVEEGARLAHFPDLVGIFNTNHCLAPKVSMMAWKMASISCAPSMRCSRFLPS